MTIQLTRMILSPVLATAVLGFFMANSAMSEPVASDASVAESPVTSALSASSNLAPSSAELDQTEASANLEQVTSVSQLSDVKPTDWAFQALQSLVERYGCIVGYPDRTFRGNQYLTRYEFAAGLNACLDKVQELIRSNTGGFATQEDLNTIKRLQEEFTTELATLRGRVDALEARTSTLEKQQFSTTTKLFGQVVVGIQGRSAPDITLFGTPVPDDADQVNVMTNAQLSLFTQLSPRSILFTGLQAGSGRNYNSLLTNDILLAYQGDTNNQFRLSDLTFRQLIGSNFAVIVGPVGVNMVSTFRGANRIESAGYGPLSVLAQRNPVQSIGGDGAGIGFDWQLAPSISVQGVYFANRPNDPQFGGIFASDFGGNTFGLQVALAPTDNIDLTLNYVNSYSPFGNLSGVPFGSGVGDDQLALSNSPDLRAPLTTDAFGATLSWRVARKLTVGGWAGFTTSDLVGSSGSVETFNWMTFLNLRDLGGRGNLAGLYFGQPPRITKSDLPNGFNVPNFNLTGSGTPGSQPDTTLHLEAFYRIRLTDNITITPGVIFIFNPRHNEANDDITIGVLRTTFAF